MTECAAHDSNVEIWQASSVNHGCSGFWPMTRKGFHILLGLILVVCALSPYVELALNWGQSLFDTGYDTETIVAVIALVLILAFALATLLLRCLGENTGHEHIVDSSATLRSVLDFISAVPEVSPPPLPLRI
jgi:hypothetical protein